jgi:hypothetical protein
MDTLKPDLPLTSAQRCWVQGRRIYLEINARRSVSFPASKYAALADASQTDLEKIELCSEGRFIRWASLDEEIQVDDVAHSRFFHTPRAAVAHAG